MNIWHDISPERIQPENFTAVIEIPKGGKNKYEMDKETGLLRLDRVLYTATHYPANYGFIPRTYADDQDPMDVLVLCSETLDPMIMVECFPIGAIRMTDGGEIDDKIIAIPLGDPTWNFYQDHLPAAGPMSPTRSSISLKYTNPLSIKRRRPATSWGARRRPKSSPSPCAPTSATIAAKCDENTASNPPGKRRRPGR